MIVTLVLVLSKRYLLELEISSGREPTLREVGSLEQVHIDGKPQVPMVTFCEIPHQLGGGRIFFIRV